MKSVILVIVTIVGLVHGYFYVRYDTAHPCHAAGVRAWSDAGREAMEEFWTSNPGFAQMGRCYFVALFGTKSKAQRAQEEEERILKRLR